MGAETGAKEVAVVRMPFLRVVRFGLVGAALLSSCRSNEGGVDPGVEKLGRASGPVGPISRAMPEMMDPKNATAPAQAVIHEGDVVERIHVPNYTYLRLSGGGRETWAAVPKTEIEVGAHVRVVESIIMEKFKSPTLDRVFDSIVFGVLEGSKGAGHPGDAGARPPR